MRIIDETGKRMKKADMNNPDKTILSKRASYILHSMGYTLLVIALIAAANTLFAKVEEKYALTMDLSKNHQFSISDETREMLRSLEEPVNIYTLFQENVQSDLKSMVTEMLMRYAAGGSVTVRNLDIIANPASAARFRTKDENLNTNSVIVASRDDTLFRVIPASKLFDYEVDYETQTYTRYDFVGEQAVNTAILQVTGAEAPHVYLLQGHGETEKEHLGQALMALEEQNYKIQELNLSDSSVFPAMGDILLISEPTRDLSEEEYRLVSIFLENGGSMYYAASYGTNGFSNFDALLAPYCLSADPGLLVENVGSTAYYYRNQIYLMPNIVTEANGEKCRVMDSFSAEDYVVLPQSRAVRQTGIRPMGLQLWNLLQTSPYAYIKGELDADTRLQKSKTDEEGSFSVATAAEIKRENGRKTRIFVIGNALFLSNDAMFTAYSNSKLLLSPMNWLAGREDQYTVPGKSMGADRLMIPNNQIYQLLCVLLICVLPLISLTVGLLIWRKRRRR